MNRVTKYFWGLLVLVGVGLLLFADKYLDLLWYQSMGATALFWVPLVTGPLVKLIFGLAVAALLFVNLFLALKSFSPVKPVQGHGFSLSKESLMLPGILACLAMAFFLTASLTMDWTVIQQFLHPVKTGVTDPIFHKDTGFYLFTYPFLRNLYNLLLTTTFLTLAGTAAIYFLSRAIGFYQNSLEIEQPAKLHLTILTTFFLAVKIWGYQLSRYGLLFNESERLTGINYTAGHANLAVLSILTWVVVLVIGLLWFNLSRKKNTLLLGGLGLWLLLSFGLNIFYPGLVQTFIVKPNERELELPYLAHHIQYTRQAYNLDRIQVQKFQPQENSTAKLNVQNPALEDLRLWDYRPLKSSYNQLQSIRPYYHFDDIDIDRYPTASRQGQVMIAARELIADQLPNGAQTSWINLHLTYTHGYGVAANQVNQFSSQGQPIFVSRDLPPKTAPEFKAALELQRPEIYFGEQTNHYIVVKTRTPEFDYPKGDGNTSTVYQGNNGIRLNSGLNKLLMMLKYKESNFMLSSQLTPESQVLMYRNITERVRKLAPFLMLDRDPYLVIVRGKLYWYMDAYTYSSHYPYASYYSPELNYIRNSVKIIVNAYDGSVNFYITDAQDPVIQVWRKIFPTLFQPVERLNGDFTKHFRYPEDLMSIQANLLSRYHMTNSKTYFAQEDNWDIPIHNTNERFNPYYVTLALPGATQGEFALMQPFSPRNKQNLSSWLIARCDGPNYGQLLLYTLPKDQNIYGPAQIDSRVNQDQTISQLITLWNQNQSRVLWGNLLIIPIDNTILYVKPLFIESEQSQQAELKKVVMVYENQVVIGNTVAEALNQLNAGTPASNVTPSKEPSAQPETKGAAKPATSERRTQILQRLEQISTELQELSRELKTIDQKAP